MPQNPDIKYASVAVFFGILIALLIISLTSGVTLLYLFGHPVIRKNTPLMSFTVLFGKILLIIGGIILCTGINDASCDIFVMFSNIGLALMLSGIIAKNYRIYKIFCNRSLIAVEIKNWQLFTIVFVITAYFILLSGFIMIVGLKAVLIQSESDPFYIYYACSVGDEFWQIFFNIFNQVSLIILRAIALILAWTTRNVGSEYSESRQIFSLVLIYFFLDVCFLPLLYTFQGGKNTALFKVVIRCIYISLIVLSTSILLYYYRYYKVYQYEEEVKERKLRRH